ncbi:MAG: L-rhamnose mutarotase, partial [Bacteroidales bacterium]|nr:L-rhamnose mutarotase [Bacteroidales bacterium]
EFDWVKDNDRLSKLPRQAEWEAYMSRFQQAVATATSAQKWQLMQRIFKLE